jgi:hypothetical protein
MKISHLIETLTRMRNDYGDDIEVIVRVKKSPRVRLTVPIQSVGYSIGVIYGKEKPCVSIAASIHNPE